MGRPRDLWTKERLKEGFQRFFKDYGRFPTSFEIDDYPLLPSSRTIERRFGGLEQLRTDLGLEVTNFTKGETRSKKSGELSLRGFEAESKIEEVLIKQFGEVFVHIQRRVGHITVDFFVYSQKLFFTVDVFCYSSPALFARIIVHKQKTYKGFPYPVILVAIGYGTEMSQDEIEILIKRKKVPLPDNCRVFSEKTFYSWLKGLQAFPDPLINAREICPQLQYSSSE